MAYNVNEMKINDFFLQNNILNIPYYQRGYVWDEENWKTLFNDVRYNETRLHYLVGSVILEEKDNNSVEIIDGQQRITTIQIMIASIIKIIDELQICLQLKDTLMNLLKADINGNLFYKINSGQAMNDIYSYTENQIEINVGSKQYDCFKYFKKILLETCSLESQLENFINGLLNCSFVVIVTDDPAESNVIFESTNAKGVKLVYSDYAKSYILNKLKNRDDFSQIVLNWRNCENRLAQSNYSKDEYFSTCFRVYFTKSSSIYPKQMYESFISKTKGDEDEIYRFYSFYNSNVESYINICESNLNDQFMKNSLILYKDKLKTSFHPLFMSLEIQRMKRIITLEEENELIKQLQIYFMYYLISVKHADKYSSRLYKLANSIYRQTNYLAIRNQVNSHINDRKYRTCINIDNLRDYLDNVKFTNHNKAVTSESVSFIKYLFKLITLNDETPAGYYSNESWNIEHILNDDDTNKWHHCLGNLIPLESDINGRMGNRTYEQKREYLSNSQSAYVQQFLDDYPTFSDQPQDNHLDIQTRQQLILEQLMNFFTL